MTGLPYLASARRLSFAESVGGGKATTSQGVLLVFVMRETMGVLRVANKYRVPKVGSQNWHHPRGNDAYFSGLKNKGTAYYFVRRFLHPPYCQFWHQLHCQFWQA